MWSLKKILFVCLALLILAGTFIVQNSKNKDEYDAVTGHIEFLDTRYADYPKRNIGKYRYLKISGYDYPFELFIGKDVGDFKPKFEQLDQLELNDRVTVYFYETNNTHEEQLNRFVQFIDKVEISYYERGNSNRIMGYFILFFSVLIAGGGYVMYKKGKIPL